jgi:hypothetical protein
MTNRPTMAAAVLFAMSIAPFASVASAMPTAGTLDIKNVVRADIETVQWRGRGGRGGGWGRGVGAGLLGGAIIGGLLASPYYYGPGPYYSYPGPYYPAPNYIAPQPGDAVAYCMQRFKSYDPSSATYLGYDGFRHPCP